MEPHTKNILVHNPNGSLKTSDTLQCMNMRHEKQNKKYIFTLFQFNSIQFNSIQIVSQSSDSDGGSLKKCITAMKLHVYNLWAMAR